MNLEYDNIKQIFQYLGYSDQDYIPYQPLKKLLDQINIQSFDQEIFQQLWTQCRQNSEGQIQIKQFIQTIIKAKIILIQKQKNCIDKINSIITKKSNLKEQYANIKEVKMRNEYKKKLQNLENEEKIARDEMTNQQLNLQILNRAFGKLNVEVRNANIIKSRSRQYQLYSIAKQQLKNPENYYLLNLILYLIIFLIILQLSIALIKIQFLNILLICSLLTIYILNYFDKLFIRFLLVLLLISELLDIIWLVLYSKEWWNITSNSLYSKIMEGYRKYCILASVLILLSKLLIGLMLIQYRNRDESQVINLKLIGVFNVNIETKSNINPISRQLEKSLH